MNRHELWLIVKILFGLAALALGALLWHLAG